MMAKGAQKREWSRVVLSTGRYTADQCSRKDNLAFERKQVPVKLRNETATTQLSRFALALVWIDMCYRIEKKRENS